MTGRQMWWCMFEYVSTGATTKNIYNLDTLEKLPWFGDDEHQMRQFLPAVIICKEALRRQIPAAFLYGMAYEEAAIAVFVLVLFAVPSRRIAASVASASSHLVP